MAWGQAVLELRDQVGECAGEGGLSTKESKESACDCEMEEAQGEGSGNDHKVGQVKKEEGSGMTPFQVSRSGNLGRQQDHSFIAKKNCLRRKITFCWEKIVGFVSDLLSLMRLGTPQGRS